MQINWHNTFQRSRSARNPSLREIKKLWLVVVPPEYWLKKLQFPRVNDRPDGKAGLDSGLDWTGFFRGVIFFFLRLGGLYYFF